MTGCTMERRVARRAAELLPHDPEHPTAEERWRLGGASMRHARRCILEAPCSGREPTGKGFVFPGIFTIGSFTASL